MIITEDWCGTSLAHVPFVASLLAADPPRGLYRSIPSSRSSTTT